MTADEAIRLIRDGDCICVNSFVGIENPIELHEAIYRRYQKMQSPTHLTMISSAGFGVWDDEHNAEGYIREGAGINRISIDDSLVKHVEVDGEEFLYYKLPKINIALIKGTAADRKGNITFDDMFMSGDALSICQAVKANRGKVIVQVDRLVDTPSRPRNAIIPGCLVEAIVVVEPETRNEAYTALTGSFEIPYEEWNTWSERLDSVSVKQSKNNTVANIIGKRASKELRVDDIVNIGIGGFANITSKTPTVVFCFSFTAKGLEVSQTKGIVTVEKEGTIPKFVDQVKSTSFSARRAIANGQKVLYVTERCVFRLTPKGLKLIEVYPGIDVQKDILELLPVEAKYRCIP